METLTELAIKYSTDKWGHHSYTPIYESYLEKLRGQKLTLLELGIGGYDHAGEGGASLRMWRDYFSNTMVIGLDIHDKRFLDGAKLVTYKGSQDDELLVNRIVSVYGSPDVIIDDASHINPLTIRSFEILFPLLKEGGIYFIEDVHTSYWAEVAADGTDFKGCRNRYAEKRSSVMNYFKFMADDLNLDVCEYPVKAIHFYKEMIVILKK